MLHYDTHSSWVLAVAWEPGGTRIASAGGDGTVRIWEAETGETLVTYHGHTHWLNMINHPAAVHTVAWSPNGRYIASAGSGTHVHVWDAATGQKLTLYQNHSGLLADVFTLAWSPDGKQIASACSGMGTDKTVHIWDAVSGRTLKQYDADSSWLPSLGIISLAWSPDGTHIAAACADNRIRVWSTVIERLVSIDHFRNSWSQTGWLSRIAWSPDSRYLASTHADHTVHIWDRLTETKVMTYHGHTDEVRCIAWSPNGGSVATAAHDRTVHIWEALTGKHIYTYRGHSHWVTSVSWSFDSTRLASASNDKTVHIWQVGSQWTKDQTRPTETPCTPVEVFYSCSDSLNDAALLEELEHHLSALQREGLISTWHKRQIVAGSVRQAELDHHLNTATLILLLVSSDFLASDYCYGTEMQRALQRHEANEAQVIPILLRACVWQSAPFAKLEMLPTEATGVTPITTWRDHDAAWTNVVMGIRQALNRKPR